MQHEPVDNLRVEALETLLRAARRTVHHWNEFEQEAEFWAVIDDLEKAVWKVDQVDKRSA